MGRSFVRFGSPIVALLLLAAGCGGTPSAESPVDGAASEQPAAVGETAMGETAVGETAMAETTETPTTDSPAEAAGPYGAVYAELEGLEDQARRDRLVELAQSEEATVYTYTSNTDMEDLAQAFTEQYGIPVEVYRARTDQVLQRALQEAEAGRLQADIIDIPGFEVGVAAREGLTVDYDGPVEADLREGSDWDGWTANRFTLISPVWNTDVLTEGPPADFADMANPRFAGMLILEPRLHDWYMTLSTWFQDNGMTQAEFDEMFLDIVRNSTLVEGNTNQVQFLAAGEFGLSAGTYVHLIDDAISAGAPLERVPVLGPMVMRPTGSGLVANTDNPASTLLLFEWMLTDAQPTFVEDYRVPALLGIEGDPLEEGADPVTIDINRLIEEGDQWEQRYEEILREAAGTAAVPAG